VALSSIVFLVPSAASLKSISNSTRRLAPRCGPRAGPRLTPKKSPNGRIGAAEDVPERLEDVLEAGGLEVALGLAAQPFVAVLIVERPLLLVGEDVVGLGDRLELRFRFLVVRVAVGMVLQRELAVRRTDLVRPALRSTPSSS
jgi:hypothetical protein